MSRLKKKIKTNICALKFLALKYRLVAITYDIQLFNIIITNNA